ncbi:MAG: 1,4-dihydroxy-2-naphthoate octaprenyltransferase [Coriobacteriia bacterium]|nr:1,4-dihydroxy-2-naphthoate octaprenyltransferase [Coriobacteriia bacterium]
MSSYAPSKKVKAWIEALRLRTLPLAASGVIIAAGIATLYGHFSWTLFILMLLMALCMQVLSNFADEYGDLASGLDDESRVGPIRALQRGDITRDEMNKALKITSAISLGLVLLLVIASFTNTNPAGYIIFILLGLASIFAAIAYTIGPKPYGYIGLGDIASFLFFGIIAVIGGVYLFNHSLDLDVILPALGLGFPTIAVLNLNNMRDAADDKKKGKITIANKLGNHNARLYHAVLLIASIICFSAYLIIHNAITWWFIPMILCFALWMYTVSIVLKVKNLKRFDKLMKPTSVTTFLVAIFFSLSLISIA